jgi:hypothetical protein
MPTEDQLHRHTRRADRRCNQCPWQYSSSSGLIVTTALMGCGQDEGSVGRAKVKSPA